MLYSLDPLRQCFDSVAGQNWYGSLFDYSACVYPLIDEVDCATGHFDPGIDGVSLGMCTGKFG